MRTILNGRCRALLAGAALLTTAFGCDNADLGAIDNAAYIAEAQKETSSTVEVGNDGTTASLTARLGGKADGEYSFRIEADPEVLERFNALNGTSYTLLPETGYEIPGDPLVIGTGDVAATHVAIKILPYTQEMDDSGQTYALPVTLHSLDGRMTVLDDASQFLIVCNRKKIVPAPVFNSEYATGGVTKRNRVILNMKDAPITFTAYTFEFMMYKEAFDYRNYMIVGFDNEDGLGNRMWVRFEASSTTADQENRWMQINSVVKPAVTATAPCEAKKWQHVAIVFDGSSTKLYLDGSLVADKATASPSITFRHFSFLPQPSYCTSTISFREARLWNTVRTEAQLKNNMNSVDPNSEGLLGYWKMDEGQGYVFKDATGHGNDGECTYSNAGDIWDPQVYGPATGLKWVEDMNEMDE